MTVHSQDIKKEPYLAVCEVREESCLHSRTYIWPGETKLLFSLPYSSLNETTSLRGRVPAQSPPTPAW